MYHTTFYQLLGALDQNVINTVDCTYQKNSM